MKFHMAVLALICFLSGCASAGPALHLSGEARPGRGPEDAGLLIGLVADSQLQTRGNFARVWGYRGPIEDWAVRVSIRPPALDWAARSMLRTHLARLAARRVRAVFYLGDGANNGCFDELAAGFDGNGDGPSLLPNDQGLLAILDQFRTESGIPVYFVLGNHDLLGAGSTSRADRRAAFCADDEGRNHPLSKLQVIALADRFNRGNDRFGPTWDYQSNFQADQLGRACGEDASRQHRTWGCYLAARVNFRSGEDVTQFLLLDTNDWASVTGSTFFGLDQEGLRGAMSFGRDRAGIPSQTGWFERNAAERVRMRVALTHYDVPGLQKHVPLFGRISRQSQLFMNLFSTPGSLRMPNQDIAYVISAHTHNPAHREAARPFRVGCRGAGCEHRQQLDVRELNIGSTTDYTSYSTVARLLAVPPPDVSLYFERIETEPSGCSDVWAEIRDHVFPNEFLGTVRGWRALGIDPADPHNYRRFSLAAMRPLWANLEAFAGQDSRRANCIGLFAASLEDPRSGWTSGRRPTR